MRLHLTFHQHGGGGDNKVLFLNVSYDGRSTVFEGSQTENTTSTPDITIDGLPLSD